MAVIRTKRGEEILVDDEDYRLLSQFTWSLVDGYAQARVRKALEPLTSCRGKVLMSRLLLAAPLGLEVDHKNRCRLDNRKDNLRILTPLQNNHAKLREVFTGVQERRGKFGAFIHVKTGGSSRRVWLGTYATFDLALLARIVGEIRYHGHPLQQAY